MPVRTRGGQRNPLIRRNEQILTTPLGVGIRKVNGRYQYNPPSLKFSCVRVLDQSFPDHGNPRLYAHVQGCLDNLIDQVEEHLRDLAGEGTV